MREWPQDGQPVTDPAAPFSVVGRARVTRQEGDGPVEEVAAFVGDDAAPMSTDYADGLAEGYSAGYRSGREVTQEAARRARALRWAAVRRIVWDGATYGAAYTLGLALGDLITRRRGGAS